MREFFKGWRRKTGCVTLAMACVFAAGMERTTRFDDRLRATFGNAHYCLVSRDGFLRLSRYICHDAAPIRNWESRLSNTGGSTDAVDAAPIHWRWHCEWYGFEIGSGHFRNETVPITAMGAPYYTAIPLTLLSAYLLLSKPRPKKPLKFVPTTTGSD
jgi:hypothetical protein